MAKAYVGNAMGVIGTDAAIETADIALMQDELGKIAEIGPDRIRILPFNMNLRYEQSKSQCAQHRLNIFSAGSTI